MANHKYIFQYFFKLTLESDLDLESLAIFIGGREKVTVAIFSIPDSSLIRYTIKLKTPHYGLGHAIKLN